MLLVCKLKRLAAVATSLCVYIFEYYAQLRYPRLSESRVAPPPCIDHLYHIVCILLVYVCKDNAFLLICKSFARYFLKMKYFTVKCALLSCVGAFIIIWEKRGHTPKQAKATRSPMLLGVFSMMQYSPDSVKSTVIRMDDEPYFWALNGMVW